MRIWGPAGVILMIWVAIYGLTRPQVVLPDAMEVQQALITLNDYGYESGQLRGSWQGYHALICGVGLVATEAAWYSWLDFCERRRIRRVIDYAREINRKVYNLRPDENSEDELSLLSNELYKTTVMLQEMAKADRQRARLMEQALTDISHQLRTPLTSLSLAVDNLYDNPEMELATRQDFLRLAGQSVQQMSDLTVALLNLAKLDNGTLKMQPRWVRVGELIEEVVRKLEILAEVSGVTIVTTGDLQAEVRVDPGWQVEALLNIVKDCLEHSQNGGEVKIAVQDSAVFTRVTISDTGEGIPAREVRHIFERFYKASNARPESVGVGLALARQLIEADNGQVRVKSREGVGTEFVVRYHRGS